MLQHAGLALASRGVLISDYASENLFPEGSCCIILRITQHVLRMSNPQMPWPLSICSNELLNLWHAHLPRLP